MKAIVYEKFGGPEVLILKEVPIPKVNDDEVLVKVKATSVNPVDYKLRKGIAKPITRFKLPLIPGGDVAGIVEEIGFKVKDFQVGQEVFGLVPAMKGGAYAEYAALKMNHLWLKPDNLNFEEAASIPLAGQTAWQGLYTKGKLTRAMNVFINGATGGVGSFAVQIAKSYNCTVTGTCSNKNIEYAREIGVDHVIAYDEKDPLKVNEKYDLFFDVSGTLSYKEIKHLLKPDAIYVNTLPSASLYVNALIKKRVKPFWVESNHNDLKELKALAEKELVRPHLDRVYPLQETAKAHRYCEEDSIQGKVAIKI